MNEHIGTDIEIVESAASDDPSPSNESKKNLLGLSEKGKRLSVTRRLENSQKVSAEMLKSLECRTSMMEDYYRRKIDYLEHMRSYHEKKLAFQQNNNKVLKEILTEAKNIKICLMGGENEDK